MPASQPSAKPRFRSWSHRASSAERAGAVPAAPVQPVAAPQVAAPSREAGGVPPQGAEGVSAPRPASPVTQSQAPSAAAPSDQLKASLQNPAALQRVWQAVLATLKKNKAAYGVLFLNTKAVYDAGKDTLIIEFPAENSFAFKAVQKPGRAGSGVGRVNQACGESLHSLRRAGRRGCHGGGPGRAGPAGRRRRVRRLLRPSARSSLSRRLRRFLLPRRARSPCRTTTYLRTRTRWFRTTTVTSRPRRRPRLLRIQLRRRRLLPSRLPRLRLRWMLARRRRPSLRCSNRPKSCRPFWPPVSAMACASKK